MRKTGLSKKVLRFKVKDLSNLTLKSLCLSPAPEARHV
jgi:hypothetical protein